MIQLTNITKSYGTKEGRFPVLKQVSLEIKENEFIVILGASGSGKSTLLNVMSGLEEADGGTISYDDTEITGLKDQALTKFRKDHIGFIFQQYYLLPNLTVEQNIKMGADLSGNKEYHSLIEELGLQDKTNKYPGELSGGEQQRVSIARALAKQPDVLFLDEPTGALDEETGRMVLDLISKLQKEYQFTIVMVTHNDHIAHMANRIVYMNSGKIVKLEENHTQKTAYEIGW